jgi:hypothetical protein
MNQQHGKMTDQEEKDKMSKSKDTSSDTDKSAMAQDDAKEAGDKSAGQA